MLEDETHDYFDHPCSQRPDPLSTERDYNLSYNHSHDNSSGETMSPT